MKKELANYGLGLTAEPLIKGVSGAGASHQRAQKQMDGWICVQMDGEEAAQIGSPEVALQL